MGAAACKAGSEARNGKTRGGLDTGRTRDGRWCFARNQSGRKDSLSAAKSDWVSQLTSAQYSVVCGEVRLGEHQLELPPRCFRSTKRSTGREERSGKGSEYAGDPRKTREQSGRPRKAREDAGEGWKVVEASGTRLEAAEEVVDAEEAREANQRFQGGRRSGDKDT